jgi:asparagine synthase (glutamine-hydrolysing)
MCGILGVREFGDHRIDERLLRRMRDTMLHRGPDAGGIHVTPDGRTGLAHRRLSIVDLSSAGQQPMSNEDGSVWIVFNGEIYNHLEIRRGLEERGHRYRSRTDTETIVHLYEEKGPDCVHDLRGMFAFAIWDRSSGSLMLARDRLGIKPLYYMIQPRRVLFASEIKAILEHPEVRRDIDTEALYHYLTFLTTPAPMTLFSGIRKLPAGHRLLVDASGSVTEEQYWDAIVPPESATRNPAEFVERIRSRLDESIRLRMMSDVPFGVFLSGGIDSSANVALMAGMMDRPVKTFTVGYRDQEGYNEFRQARRVAELYGTEHHEVVVTNDDMLEFLPRLIHHQDEPIADPVCVPLYFVSRLAKERGVTVVQVGEGSDELFSGYPGYLDSLRFRQGLYRQLALVPRPVGRLIARTGLALSRVVHRGFNLRDNLRKAAAGEEPFWGGAIVFTETDKALLLSESFRRAHSGLTSYDIVMPHYERIRRAKPESDLLERMIYLELKLRLPELLLMRIDKITMAVAVEARVPFLDHRMVEDVMPIPAELKIGGGAKALLKRAMRGVIPDDVIDRPKQGFGAPIREWFLGAIGERLRSIIRHSSLRERGFFDDRYVESMLDAHRAGRGNYGSFIWSLLNLSLWHDHWIARREIEAPRAAGTA